MKKGGVIFAWGSTDIDDATSELHTRYEIGVHSFDYLVAVPGTERREALLFSAVIPSSAAGERLDDDTIRAAGVLADAIMSTFRWSAP